MSGLQAQGGAVADTDHVQQEDAHSDDANGGDEHARGRRHGDVGGNEIPHEAEDGDDDNELDQVHKPALQRRHNDSMRYCRECDGYFIHDGERCRMCATFDVPHADSSLWEFYGHVRLVTRPVVRWQRRDWWFQDNTVYASHYDFSDYERYSVGAAVHDNFIPQLSGPMKMRPGKRSATIIERCVNIVNMMTMGLGWQRRTRKTSTD